MPGLAIHCQRNNLPGTRRKRRFAPLPSEELRELSRWLMPSARPVRTEKKKVKCRRGESWIPDHMLRRAAGTLHRKEEKNRRRHDGNTGQNLPEQRNMKRPQQRKCTENAKGKHDAGHQPCRRACHRYGLPGIAMHPMLKSSREQDQPAPPTCRARQEPQWRNGQGEKAAHEVSC